MRPWHKGVIDSLDDGFKFPNEPPYAPPVWAGPPSVATASVGSLGTIASFSRGGAASSVRSSAAAPAATQVTTAGSGLVINLNWDSSVGSAPAAFTNDMIAAAHFAESLISNAVTINLAVGYNEINGSALGGGALGESQTNIQSVSYSALVAALAQTGSKDAADTSVLASLPATNPAPGNVWVTTAQAKALGLSAANGSGTDGAVGFGTSSKFTYGSETTGTVAAGTFDFFATALHEMSEVMGRILLVGTSISGGPGYTLMDLLHYSAPGTRDFVQSTPGYFSVNSGATNLGAFNTVSGGDAGDWASSVTNDPLDAFATSGVVESGKHQRSDLDGCDWLEPGQLQYASQLLGRGGDHLARRHRIASRCVERKPPGRLHETGGSPVISIPGNWAAPRRPPSIWPGGERKQFSTRLERA